jgi:hypothetical protein
MTVKAEPIKKKDGIANSFEERKGESGYEYSFKTDTKISSDKYEDIINFINTITGEDYKKIEDKLDRAISAFENENSETPFSERFSQLRWAWMDNAFDTMKYIKKNGIKNPISENKRYVQEEGIKQFGIMEKMYNLELKAGEKKGKKQEDIDTEWLKEVKKMKSSMGSIVRDMREGLNEKTGTNE